MSAHRTFLRERRMARLLGNVVAAPVGICGRSAEGLNSHIAAVEVRPRHGKRRSGSTGGLSFFRSTELHRHHLLRLWAQAMKKRPGNGIIAVLTRRCSCNLLRWRDGYEASARQGLVRTAQRPRVVHRGKQLPQLRHAQRSMRHRLPPEKHKRGKPVTADPFPGRE